MAYSNRSAARLTAGDIKAIDALKMEAASQGEEYPVGLYGYQKKWILDTSRWKIGMWTRQGGKSFGTSLEAVDNCCEKRTKWVLLSAGERQSKELMQKVQMHARAYGKACEVLEEDFVIEDKKFKQLEVNFPNLSRIIGLPANPGTARGHTAHILLDEFAFHKKSREIWTSMFPTVTRGFNIRIISTPQGRKNKFYELHNNKGYSHHKVTIYDAIAQGLILKNDDGSPCTPEELREVLADDEAWGQEYMCEFVDEATAFLSYDLISTVEDGTINPEPEWVERVVARATAHHEEYLKTKKEIAWDASDILRDCQFSELYAGFDVARKKDFSIIWLDDLTESRLKARAVIKMDGTPFFVQKRVLWAVFAHPAFRRGCIDCTGIGAQIAEEAVERFGASKVEGVTFSTGNKEALAGGLKSNFEDMGSEIPVDTRIRESLHSVKRYATATGHFRFDAERSDETGHADHFWAKSLAVQAYGKREYQKVEYESLEGRREYGN